MTSRPSKSYAGTIDLTDRNSAWTKLLELVGHSTRVLEVGCATGHMSAVLKHTRGCHVTAIEVDPHAARAARPYCDVLLNGDVERGALDLVHGPFDIVIFADVLEHLVDPLRVLRATLPLLGPAGYVLVSLPNVAHWDVRRALLQGRFEYTRTGILDDTHLRFFTYDTALRLIHDAGFRVEHFDLVFRCPRHWRYPDFYRRWERPLYWLVTRFFRGLFGYQFIFQLAPSQRAGVHPLPQVELNPCT